MRLIAMIPVLYLAHQYDAGDELPVNDPHMTELWLEAGSAAWEDDSQAPAPKAKPAAAQAGMTGISDSGIDDDLVGRIPETPERKREAKPRTRKKA